MFLFVFGIVVYNAVNASTDMVLLIKIIEKVQNSRNGIIAIMFVLIFEATLRTYDGPFLRPNKAFWRACLRMCVLYLCALVFLIF
jgi:hypothetical protein